MRGVSSRLQRCLLDSSADPGSLTDVVNVLDTLAEQVHNLVELRGNPAATEGAEKAGDAGTLTEKASLEVLYTVRGLVRG